MGGKCMGMAWRCKIKKSVMLTGKRDAGSIQAAPRRQNREE